MTLMHKIFVGLVVAIIFIGAFNSARNYKSLWVSGGGRRTGGWLRGVSMVVLGMIGVVTGLSLLFWVHASHGWLGTVSAGAVMLGVTALIGVFFFAPPHAWLPEEKKKNPEEDYLYMDFDEDFKI